MRNLFKLALLTALFVALTVTPALAKKKAPLERTIVDGVALAEVRPSTQMQPYYPATARLSKLHAEVIVSLQVLENGRVGKVDVLSSSAPDVGCEQSVADAVRHWRFHPALKDGEPVETATLVRLTFAPPTLRSPEGFVFAETSPRSYAAAFTNTFTDRTWTEQFRDSLANHEARQRLQRYDIPDCPRDRRKGCLYDKSELSQFSGTIVTENPHNTPVQPPRRGGR